MSRHQLVRFSPPLLFSQLPPTPVAGMSVPIFDSPVSAFGATITSGGGSNHVNAYYNGSSWTVSGNGTISAADNNNHIRVSGGTPGVSGAGNTVTGGDTGGTIVLTGGATSTTLTFAHAFNNTPFVVLASQAGTAPHYTVSTTAITITVAAANDTINYVALAASGG